jgi:hypothetical protein
MVHVVRWNGKDLPDELRRLPPGDYVLEPVASASPPLTPEEEEGIRKALASRDAGRIVSHEDVRRSVDELLKR